MASLGRASLWSWGHAVLSLAQGSVDGARAASPLLGALWQYWPAALSSEETAEWILCLV